MTDADSSSLMINKLIKQARLNNYKSSIINLLLLNATNLYNNGKFDLALKETYQIEKEVRNSQDFSKISHLLAPRANCYGNLYYFEKSNQCLIESKYYAEKIKDNDSKYFNLGRIYRLWSLNINNNKTVATNFDSVMYYRKKATKYSD